MESINIHLQELESVIDTMDEFLERARRSSPFSKNVSVDRDFLFELIENMRPILYNIQKDLPNEIVQAKRVMSDSDKLINEARSKAALIISNAEAEVVKMTNEHEIMKLAQEQSQEIIEEARQHAKEYRLRSKEYADDTLLEVENIIRNSLDSFARHAREVEEYYTETIDVIYENRQQLRNAKK